MIKMRSSTKRNHKEPKQILELKHIMPELKKFSRELQ